MATMKCPQCGTIVEAAAGWSPVCPNCGFGSAGPSAPTAAVAPAPKPKAKATKKHIWIGLGIGIVVAGLMTINAVMHPSPAAGNGEGSTAPAPGLFVGKPASDLVIALSDLPAGYQKASEGAGSLGQPSEGDGYARTVLKAISENSYGSIKTVAARYNSTDAAKSAYSNITTAVRNQYSTTTKSHGDDATYWEITGRDIRMVVRKANVVWRIEMTSQGAFSWDPTIDQVADKLVAKAT